MDFAVVTRGAKKLVVPVRQGTPKATGKGQVVGNQQGALASSRIVRGADAKKPLSAAQIDAIIKRIDPRFATKRPSAKHLKAVQMEFNRLSRSIDLVQDKKKRNELRHKLNVKIKPWLKWGVKHPQAKGPRGVQGKAR